MKKPTDAKQKIEAAKVVSDTEDLKEIARDPFVYVRAGVAINPAATEEILLLLIPEKLATEDDFQVSAAVLSRGVLPPSVAHSICAAIGQSLSMIGPRSYYPKMCWLSLVSHPSAALNDLCELLQLTCPRHLRSAATSTSRLDVLDLLCRDAGTSVSAKARRRVMTQGV